MSEKKTPSNLIEMPLEEALTRLLRTDPQELAEIQQEVRKKKEEIQDNVSKIREDIHRGIRPPGKRFRQ
jgi:uncharacterized protein Yka (UPF0111/DUF47 family)